MNDTTQKLFFLASKHFNVEASSLKPEDDLYKTLGLNSLQALSLLTLVENEFQIEIPDYELQGIHTFSSLAEIIERRK